MMQIVIDIPGEIRKSIFDGVYCGILDDRVYDAIKNGTPLPEGHGRLIDADNLVEVAVEIEMHGDTFCIDSAEELENWLDDEIPTVIEADRSEE